MLIFGKVFESKVDKKQRQKAERDAIKEELKIEIQTDLDKVKREENERAAEELRLAKEANEPFVNVVGIIPDPDHGVKIEMDWNDAFIKHLKENGYTGADDNVIIQKYILKLTAQISSDMLGDNGNGFE